MDIYKRKNRWKLNLVFAGIFIVLVTIGYTFYLGSRLKNVLEINMENFADAYESMVQNMDDLNKDVNFETDVIQRNTNIPIIIVDELDSIVLSLNFSVSQESNSQYMRRQLEKMQSSDRKPITIESMVYRIYYAPPFEYKLLSWLPLIILLLLATYIFIGYLGFSSSRTSEQNRVWVGMARETAHQLGTPISAIIAWLEHLKVTHVDEEQLEIIDELENDVSRLELIADRFSKIGAEPNLERMDVVELIRDTMGYMEKRAPRKIEFKLMANAGQAHYARVNKHLINWVFENLMRNALDAMGGEGMITTVVSEDEESVNIDVSDTGKGIASGNLKTVFEPGYTTRKRGWGLGLSLARRIIENYHQG
ncbi:MAG TPA: HAMP domain-containing sensor histidine kinase, partial [Membranihabitans sp.]|nr:HAMP domain-containing sensor histidine kinase [Membranihabitans sp.]